MYVYMYTFNQLIILFKFCFKKAVQKFLLHLLRLGVLPVLCVVLFLFHLLVSVFERTSKNFLCMIYRLLEACDHYLPYLIEHTEKVCVTFSQDICCDVCDK